MRKKPRVPPPLAKAAAPSVEPVGAETELPGVAAAAPEPAGAQPAAGAPEPGVGPPVSDAAPPAPAAGSPEPGAGPPLPQAEPAPGREGDVARLERELADQKDRLLRTAADFDNFRKRAAKDKAETWGRAQADLAQRILEAIDDLGRVAHLDPAQTSAQALHEGMGLVERKLLKSLETVGLERLDPSAAAFDPNVHEAVMTVPAPAEDMDGKVSTVFQAGYRMNGLLLRPARVAVYAWAGAPPGGELVN